MPSSRAFLLLHGYANYRPPEHWEHWLARSLTEAGQPVIYPQLPTPEQPSLTVWLDALGHHLEALAALTARERVVICHSLSCLLWFHGCSQVTPASRPDRLILVSPPASERLPDGAGEFAIDDVDPGALRASVRTEIRIVGSDDDPYNPAGVPRTYGDPLGLPCDTVPGAGHISADDGYGPWPAMLAWCANPGGPVPPEPGG